MHDSRSASLSCRSELDQSDTQGSDHGYTQSTVRARVLQFDSIAKSCGNITSQVTTESAKSVKAFNISTPRSSQQPQPLHQPSEAQALTESLVNDSARSP